MYGLVCATEMLGSCVGVAALAILFEGVKVLRDYINMKYCSRDAYGGVRCADSSDNASNSMSTSNSRADLPDEQTHAEYRHKPYV